MTIVKICGITTYEDALAAVEAGADMLGLNFYKPSPRYITPEVAQPICDRLRAELGARCPILVGLFVNEIVGRISITMEKVGLNCVQLSGDESDELQAELRGVAFKGIRPRNTNEALEDAKYYLNHAPQDSRLPSLLIDAYQKDKYGGTGEAANIEAVQAVKAITPRLMLAGGLTPANVSEMVRLVGPWGVDVASGVESEPGRKDPVKMKDFVQAAKSLSQS